MLALNWTRPHRKTEVVFFRKWLIGICSGLSPMGRQVSWTEFYFQWKDISTFRMCLLSDYLCLRLIIHASPQASQEMGGHLLLFSKWRISKESFAPPQCMISLVFPQYFLWYDIQVYESVYFSIFFPSKDRNAGTNLHYREIQWLLGFSNNAEPSEAKGVPDYRGSFL